MEWFAPLSGISQTVEVLFHVSVFWALIIRGSWRYVFTMKHMMNPLIFFVGVLPKSLPVCKVISGSQDFILRSGTISFLRHDSCWLFRLSYRWIFLKGMLFAYISNILGIFSSTWKKCGTRKNNFEPGWLFNLFMKDSLFLSFFILIIFTITNYYKTILKGAGKNVTTVWPLHLAQRHKYYKNN